MESGGHRSEGGAVHGAEGALCHACGYQYPNGHPSAKQRRAHRKHCGKPESAAGEHQARVLFPGEVGGAAVGGGGGGGIGASAAECGGGAPGSAREAGSAAADVDGTEHSSHDGAGAQVIIDKFVDDHSDIASKITPETNRTDDGGTLNDVATATQDYGKASLPEGGVSSVPASAVTSEQPQDVCVPVLSQEPGYDEGVSPELPVSAVQNSNVVSGGEISEQINVVTTEPNDTTVTGVDGTFNTIDKDIPVEEKSAKGNDLDSSCQEDLEIKVGEGHSNTTVEEDTSDKNLSAVQIEEIPNDEPEPNQQISQILTSSVELVPNTEEHVKFGTQVPVGTDNFHLEATDTVKPQDQPHSISVAEDCQTVLEQTDISEGEHYPNNDEATETISSAIRPAVNAEVISVGDADNMTKNVSSSDVSMGDCIKEIVTNNNVVPSQADLVVLSTSSTTHDTNMVNSTDDFEEKGQNVKSVADLTTHEINEVHTLVEDKQLDKEVADSISHETNAFSSTDNYGENEKEIIAEATSCNIPSTSSIEQEKQIEEVINNPAPEKTNMTSNNCVEEKKQIDVDVKTNRDISVLCTTEAIEEKGTTSDIKAENTTSNVEDKKQSEEIGAGDISDGTSMIYSTVNTEKMHNEDVTEGPSSHEKIVVNSTENVEEKYETTVDPTSHSTGIITAIDSVEERKNDETSANLTSPGINAEHASDSIEEKKDGEPILESTSYKIETVGGTDDVKEKQKDEETTADQISGENNTAQGTYDAEALQNKDTATVPVSDNSLVSDKSEVAKKPDAVEGTEQKEEVAAKEISTVQSTDDLKEAGQNEEIADKEVIVDSDRSHVSLKVLLADKNVETKEKKPSTKDRVLSFRRRSSSKDNESPAKPGSPKAGSGQPDWNSPARLPAEKKPKGKKQQWVPFICCTSIH